MFIKTRKQGGFISAELGIGILVISLLTIIGFLAASDLDDEISRSPEDKSKNYALLESIDIIKSLQVSTDSGDVKRTLDEQPPGQNIATSGSRIFDMYSSSSPCWSNQGSTQRGRRYVCDEIYIEISANPNDSNYNGYIRLYLGVTTEDSCQKLYPEFKDLFTKMGYSCGSDAANTLVTGRMSQYKKFLQDQGYKEPSIDTSLDGTWMGDL